MPKTLFLLDAMALIYRAHFALVQRPIFTSKGVNTSALYGFTQTLLDLLAKHQPTHLGVAFDTAAPTERHELYAEYKAQREAAPEDILDAIPHVQRMLAALHIPALIRDGYEADDIIGTLVKRAEPAGFTSYMVTPDKDFGQLVTDRTQLYKPGRTGGEDEILGPKEILEKWGIERPEQVIDILGLAGDASDNIPGVPGIGPKTAAKLIAQYGSVENLLEHANELKGKQRERLEAHREQALLSKKLATIDCQTPIETDWDSLIVRPADDEALKALLVEFEFNSIGRRLYGDAFKAGRGFAGGADSAKGKPSAKVESTTEDAADSKPASSVPAEGAPLERLQDVVHKYSSVETAPARAGLCRQLKDAPRIGLAAHLEHTGTQAPRLRGLAFAAEGHQGWFVPLPSEARKAGEILAELRPVLETEGSEKLGHDLKPLLAVLRSFDLTLGGRLFDVMLAHTLVEPDQRHALAYLAERYLGYTLEPLTDSSVQSELALDVTESEVRMEPIVEQADVALRLRDEMAAALQEKSQERVFFDIESPLLPVLVDMEHEGIRVDAATLAEFAVRLGKQMEDLEGMIHRLAGTKFNVNSPRQLGEILFDHLQLSRSPKKTRTGQYATDEKTLQLLAVDHEIVRHLLNYRACSKLKSTYADALPLAIDSQTGRVHTTYHQLATATGRLNSQNPNLQNIPIRTELGQEIRKAFVPRDDTYILLSADYSQIELRIIAALSREAGLLEAFASGADVHTATAARVFGVPPDDVTHEMRKQAKMVNYGIAYGISAFGLAQRLAIPRAQAAEIIDHYFAQFQGIQTFMNETIEFARTHGYVETVSGRRRYLRDITSANATVRAAAERNAINAPIQGTAADMIKIAMVRLQRELQSRELRTRMLLQVHDELVLDLHREEEAMVLPLVEETMRTALTLDIPIVVEMGTGDNWLEAH